MRLRSRFVVMSVAISALALLVGGADASALTVRCVPSMSVAGSCQASYATIQAAANAAVSGDIIVVGRGIYHETVTVSTPGLSFFGAQAGVYPATRALRKQESVVSATGTGSQNAGFIIKAQNVLIEGFTVEGATDGASNGGGIDLKGGTDNASGATVVDNILQGNAVGLYLNFEGAAPVSGVLIQHNLFRDNLDSADHISDGIFTSGCQNVTIRGNLFSGDRTSAIGINNSANVAINGNQSDHDGTFVIFTGTTNSNFAGNSGANFLATAPAFGSGESAVAVGPNNSGIVISGNRLKDGATTAILFTDAFGAGANSAISVTENRISNVRGSGIEADSDMLDSSTILGNKITNSRHDGIFLDSGDAGNLLNGNMVAGSHGFDCHDASTGTGSKGTANFWFRNFGVTSSPAGLCIK